MYPNRKLKLNISSKPLTNETAIYVMNTSDLGIDANIENQIYVCMEKIKNNNWTHYDTYIDENISIYSKFDERKGLIRLLEDAKDKKFQNLVIWRMDRLDKDMVTLNHLIRYIISDLKINVFSCEENINMSTSSGNASVGFVSCGVQFSTESTLQILRLNSLKIDLSL